eukprot:g24600.t1
MSTAYYGRVVPLALRRFVKLPCRRHSPTGRAVGDLMLPDGLPTGVHVVMLMTRRKHIEHADSWLGVRSACERLLMERQMALKGEMQMYLCCLLPRFWPLRWFWRYRMCSWARLLEEEEQTQVHILSCTKWSSFFQKMQIHNDGRAHTMVIRNDGEILWVGHDRFQEQFHEREMVNVVNEECQSREDAKLLEGGVTGAIEASEELTVAAGSGKSLVAMAMLFRAVAEEARAYYTCPVKALVSEKFFALCRDFGSELIGMATGDVSINSQASIICCTAEVLANVALRGANHDLQYAVMDEFHFFADKGRRPRWRRGRGYAWEVPLFRLPQVTFLLMSATMGRNEALNANLERFTGRENVREAIFELVADGRAPIYVVSFTQDAAATLAQSLITKDRDPTPWCMKSGEVGVVRRSLESIGVHHTKAVVDLAPCQELAPSEEQKHTLSEAMKSTDFDTPYGPRRLENAGDGTGARSPSASAEWHWSASCRFDSKVSAAGGTDARRKERTGRFARMAQSGLLTCICGTDTLGVGVNVPIRSVLFTQLCKYNGESTALLSARDFHQIAGRAGRKGFDEAGSVVAVAPAHEVYNQKHGLIECQPVPGDKQQLTESSPAALESQFQLSQGHVLSVLQGAQERADGRATSVDGTSAWHGREELRELIELSVCSEEKKQHWQEQVESYISALGVAGLVELHGDEIRVDSTLQRDFLLMETQLGSKASIAG